MARRGRSRGFSSCLPPSRFRACSLWPLHEPELHKPLTLALANVVQVYLGLHNERTPVAVKLLNRDGHRSPTSLQREVAVTEACRGPNIVQVSRGGWSQHSCSEHKAGESWQDSAAPALPQWEQVPYHEGLPTASSQGIATVKQPSPVAALSFLQLSGCGAALAAVLWHLHHSGGVAGVGDGVSARGRPGHEHTPARFPVAQQASLHAREALFAHVGGPCH